MIDYAINNGTIDDLTANIGAEIIATPRLKFKRRAMENATQRANYVPNKGDHLIIVVFKQCSK